MLHDSGSSVATSARLDLTYSDGALPVEVARVGVYGEEKQGEKDGHVWGSTGNVLDLVRLVELGGI